MPANPSRGGLLHPTPTMLLSSLCFLGACSKGEGTASPPSLFDTGITGGADADADGTTPPASGPYLETTLGVIHADAPALGAFPGLVGVPNLDDDDGNGEADWAQAGEASGDNDFALATLVTDGNEVTLSLSGTGIRLYAGEDLILGDGAAMEYTTASDLDLRVEFDDFIVQGLLTFVDRTTDTRFEVELTASPLFFNHHLQAAEETMAMAVSEMGYRNDRFIDGYEEALGSAFFSLSAWTYDYDVWVQDEFEFAYATAPDAHLEVIFDTHRNGQGYPGDGLDDFPENEYAGPDWLITNWGSVSANSQDYGGNFEVSPPVTVDGVSYPYGRVYYGGDNGYYDPHDATEAAVEGFGVQKPFKPDAAWLCVGHIDEFTSTIPDPTAPKGFRFVMADTASAWAVLEGMDPDLELTRYQPGGYAGHSIDTVGEILEDTALRYLNDELQDILDEQEEIFRRELNLTDEDIIYMPSLFEEVDGCWGGVASLIPGMANLIVGQVDGVSTLFLADPFLRTDVNDQASDPMIMDVRSRFPSATNLVFLDDWQVYHMGLGEVHCGSNVKRTAPKTWWEDAGHLIPRGGGR